MAAPVPVCRSVILCMQILQDARTQTTSLIGLVQAIRGLQFPTVGQFSIFSRWTNGHGDYHIEMQLRDAEGTSNYRTLEELNAALDSETFWRPHRSYLVNIQHIKEVVPWFKSSYMLKMSDKKHTEIPVSRAQTKRLRELFKL